MDNLQKLIIAFETHAAAGIRECFKNGIDPNQQYAGKPLIYALINMYLRSPSFRDCIKVFVEFGLEFEDKALLSVLLDDAILLDRLLTEHKILIAEKYSLDCAFTPLSNVTLLHVCAEYNHLECAKILVKHGAEINAKAGIDRNGFGGQTPIFHTVNQHQNVCMDMMRFLISNGADLLTTVKGITWGKGYEWETFIPAVNPISYTMMGLLRQFQRTEKDIYAVVQILMQAAYGVEYEPHNIPNKYLNK